MEDQKSNIKKIIAAIAIIIIVIFSIIIIYNQYKKNEDNRIENKLKKEGYEKVTEKIYQKNQTENDNEISYTYNIANNEFEKIVVNNNSYQEMIDLLKKNDIITVTYSYQDSSCTILQTALYKNGKLEKCDISNKTPNCKAKCDRILEETKIFDKEKLQ